MNNSDVQLWFANNKDNKIVTINEIDKEHKHNKYTCCLCNSEVIPKQGKEKSWHFAHKDKSKCSNESMYHFWIKNKLLQNGDKFIIKSDMEKEYICKEILVEQIYIVNRKQYKPDLTVITETDETIYFEIANTNKKKIEDYLDIWIGLNNIVVEVDVKTLINLSKNSLLKFKALWYEGKCFNIRKNDTYYNTIGKYKAQLIKDGVFENKKEDIEKLDWFWKDVLKYKNNEVNIEYMVELIDAIDDENDKEILEEILNKPRCNKLIYDYKKYKTINIINEINPIFIKYAQKKGINDYFNYIKINENQGTIDILDPTDNCFIVYDIFESSRNKLVDNIIEDLSDIVKYNEKKEKKKVWEDKRNELYKEIIEHPKIKQYVNKFNEDINKYKLEIDVSPYRFEVNNKQLFQIILTYNTYGSFGVVAIREEKEIEEYYNIDNLYNFLNKNVSGYFSKLNTIDGHMITILNKICQKLKKRYDKTIHNIEIENRLWLEDIYEIKIYNNSKINIDEKFYITNDGVISDDVYIRDKKIILKSRDENEIENYIIDKLSNKIRQQMYKGGIYSGK
jgi:uncharacterized C2H2 Zn-finger protein